eukprot:CAMPEP_0173201158 /NCGR_PEP_ID=MMETSP1141-20130122/18194_1 /TAXON_ID=483371 /ORGANISM="non described non described, Strain CCMP2298" /LENGTH=95 /DNA_ID=CAMNT_0014126245 /DNA_START=134 /DNA_END=421 /DNA_ORIENTATION=-
MKSAKLRQRSPLDEEGLALAHGLKERKPRLGLEQAGGEAEGDHLRDLLVEGDGASDVAAEALHAVHTAALDGSAVRVPFLPVQPHILALLGELAG